MALVVFLRGINVGGSRTFRPKLLAQQLSDYDVVNVGAAGTLVVRRTVSLAKLDTELRRRLPFEAEIAICRAGDLVRLETENPFGTEPSGPGVVRFVSILAKTRHAHPSLPVAFPPSGDWLVRVLESQNRFVFGVYRRHMKTIGYLGQIDKLFGARATTRNWSTILAVVEILKRKSEKGNFRSPSPRRSNETLKS